VNITLVAIFQGTVKFSSSNVYALMGSASFLGGVGRNPVTFTVLLLECTGDIRFGLPLMVTLIGAQWIGNKFGPSLFAIHIKLKNLPFLQWSPPEMACNLPVKLIMHSDPICFERHVNVGVAYDLLNSCTHNGFPVTEKHPFIPSVEKYFRGYILRHHVTTLLKNKAFFKTMNDIPKGNTIVSSSSATLTYDQIEGKYPRYPNIKNIIILPEEREMWLDLGPYLHPAPYTVQTEMTIRRVYKLFRSMGLRHLMVLDQYNDVKGIITRKDLDGEIIVKKIQDAAMNSAP
jgi:chloride channel 7